MHNRRLAGGLFRVRLALNTTFVHHLGISHGLEPIRPTSTVAAVLAFLLWRCRVADLVFVIGIVWRDALDRIPTVIVIPVCRIYLAESTADKCLQLASS